MKQDAIPGRIITVWFQSLPFAEMKAIKDEMNQKAGDGGALLGADTPSSASFDVQCAEMCGVGHGIMSSKVIFHTDEDYANWQAANAPIAE
jgi:heme/copper-type cytochrome/quinol oxidase subunit 2